MGTEEDRWLANTLRQSPAAASEACLDAETLAAWADGGLSAQAAAAVELHASNCSRCMAVLAAMERTAPAPSATHAWTPARLFRWVAPIAAVATAVAIWIAVPSRPITPIEPRAGQETQDLSASSQRVDQTAKQNTDSAAQVPAPVPGAVPVPVPQAALEPSAQNRNPAPGTQNPEPQMQVHVPPPAEEQNALRDELRRERAAPQASGATAGAAAGAVPESAPPAAPPAAAPTAKAAPQAAAPPETLAADSFAETVTMTAERSASSSRSNPSIRWRVVMPALIERSTNGGRTWTRTASPAATVVAVRGVDANRAVARTSDNTEFYTTNGGRSWTRVQENSAAPF